MTKKEDKKSKEDKPTKNNELATKILAVMGELRRNGVTEINSTTLRDKVGTKTRAVIRRAMKGLAEAGMVVISEKMHGKRKRYTYSLA